METIDFAPRLRSQQTSITDILRSFNETRSEDDGRLELHELEKKILSEHFIMGQLDPLARVQYVDCFDKIKENMATVVMVVPVSSIFEAPGNDWVIIKSKPLYRRQVSTDYAICKSSAYATQPSAFCNGSGFFAKENVIATAAHVVVGPNINLQDLRFIRGIYMEQAGDFEQQIVVHKAQVYKPVLKDQILPASDYELFAADSDWALISVVPAYAGFGLMSEAPFVKIKNKAVGANDPLYAIGHGLGLPLKVSFDGEVMDVEPAAANFFESKLTLLGGNSGSPVFCAATHQLVGIYMRGVKKLQLSPNGKCFIVKNERDAYEGQECLRTQRGCANEK